MNITAIFYAPQMILVLG